MILYEQRASSILYNFLKSNPKRGKYIIPSNVCPVIPMTFYKAKVEFEFVDISLETFCLSEQKVFEKLKNSKQNYSGVFFVRTYGIEESFEDFFKQIKALNNNLIIIDDKCLCEPLFDLDYSNKLADLTLFSTGFRKQIDIGLGGVGFLNTNYNYQRHQLNFDNKDLIIQTNKYKNAIQQKVKFNYIDNNWLNNQPNTCSFEEYQEIVNIEKVKARKIRTLLNTIYYENLPEKIILRPFYNNWRFNITVSERNSLLTKIFQQDLYASCHYASLDGIFSTGKSENSEKLCSNIINLFNDKNFTSSQALETCRIVNTHLIKYKDF